MNKKNWSKRVREAEKTGKFTSNDIMASNYWGSCAVGEKLIRDHGRLPYMGLMNKICSRENKALRRLGSDFTYAVTGNQVQKARKIFEKIQGYRTR